MIAPLLGIFLVLTLLMLFMWGLNLAANRFRLHPEWTRKILHIGMGSVSLCFPLIFHDTWPVMLLACLAIAWLWSARRISWLHGNFGAVLTEVRRQSWGEIFFAISVAILFWASQGSILLFCIPVAILTFADAGAALVGVRWGKKRLLKLDKTLEGSLAFLLIAFCIIKISLSSGIFFGQSFLLAAVIVAFVSTMVEAVSRDGIDNLSVPIAAFALLKIWI